MSLINSFFTIRLFRYLTIVFPLVVLICDGYAQSIGFKPGEPATEFIARMRSLGAHFDYNSGDSMIRLNDTIWSVGYPSIGTVVTVDEAQRVNLLVMYFNEPLDSLYVGLTKKLGPPLMQDFDSDDSLFEVTFRDSLFDYELSVDSFITISARDTDAIPLDRKWVELTNNDVGKFEVDTSIGNDRFLVVKFLPDSEYVPLRDLLEIKHPNMGYSKYRYNLTLFEVDRPHRIIRQRNQVDFTEDNRLIKYSTEKNTAVSADSDLGKAILDFMCGDASGDAAR